MKLYAIILVNYLFRINFINCSQMVQIMDIYQVKLKA